MPTYQVINAAGRAIAKGFASWGEANASIPPSQAILYKVLPEDGPRFDRKIVASDEAALAAQIQRDHTLGNL